jgi:signal transduction histidine kinase
MKIALFVMSLILLTVVISVLYYVYLKRRVLDPFKKLKGFAVRVAGGNLDTPLEMDKGNVFGPFTESFDIMREELKASREREEKAVKSRKELVAQLSHDIKTPVSSIKAMTDVMSLTASEEDKVTINAINAKADQIDSLISNLFHATLEELEQLEVKPEDINSTDIVQMIKDADYLNKIEKLDIKDAVVFADRLRLNQVLNNIIFNSYKYADTMINVTSRFENAGSKYLFIEIADKGPGVPEEELEMITQKFKRGSNAGNKDGSGLGLYISDYLMNKMEGCLTVRNTGDGFAVEIGIKIS